MKNIMKRIPTMKSLFNHYRASIILNLFILLFFTFSNHLFSQSIGDYRSVATGNWNAVNTWERYNGSTWLTPTASEGTPTNASGVITIQSGHTVSVTANVTADQIFINSGGQVIVSSGITFTVANGAGTDLTVNGTLVNSGAITFNANVTAAFESGSTYHHAINGGSIPIATWNLNSTCLVTGIIGNLPSNLGQSFGNLIWNCPAQTVSSTPTTTFNIQGNLIIQNTNTGQFRMGNGINIILGNYTQSGGIVRIAANTARTLTISGNLNISGGTLLMSSGSAVGTLNIAGNFTHIGGTITETASGSGSIVFNGGNIQFYTSGGTISNTINFTIINSSKLQMFSPTTVVSGGGSFTLSSGATLGITSTSGIDTTGATGNIQVSGKRTFNTGANYIYNGTSNQSTGTGFPTNLTGILTINNSGNTVTLNNARTIANLGSINLTAGTFATGTNLTMAATSTINRIEGSITGTLQGSGTYNVVYTGNSKTTGSELSGSGLNNITTNLNSGQTLTLGQSRTVPGTLTMTNGNIITGANILTLGSGTGVLGTLSRTSGTIIGNFRRWFNNTTINNVLFPIGTATNYRPVNISFTTAPTTGGTITAFFTASNPGTTGFPLNDGATQIINAGIDGYWTINTTTLIGGTYTLDLTADGFSGVSVVSSLRILKRPTGGGNWTLQGTHSPGTGILTTPIVHRTGMSGFSEFGIGAAADNALPVELSSFYTSVVGNSIKLNWKTETEVNNYGFEIERQSHTSSSLNVLGWEKIGFVNGNGNTNSPKSYSFVDKTVLSGKYSYRLKQIDNDGKYEFSNTVEVDLGSPTKFELSPNYPNPFNPTTTIRFSLPEASDVKLTIYNILGQEVQTLINGEMAAGIHTIDFGAQNLSSGIYIYKLEAGSFIQTKKMTVLK